MLKNCFDGEQLTGREPDPVIVTDIIARAKNTALSGESAGRSSGGHQLSRWGLVPKPLARLYRDLAEK